MNKDIVFFSPWRGFSEMVRQTASEINEECIDVVEIFLGECSKVVQQLELENCKIIIAKEYWVPYVNAVKTKILTFPIHVTMFDLFQNISAISKKKKRIAYIGSTKEARHYDFKWLKQTQGVEIIPLLYNYDEDIEFQVNAAFNENLDCVLTTGACIAKMCKDKGIPARVVCPGKESVVEAIYRAKELLSIYRNEMEYRRHVYAVASTLPHGLVAFDKTNKITLVNPLAEKVLNISSTNVVGRSIEELSHLPSLQKVFGDGNPAYPQVQRIGERKVIINRLPMKVGEEQLGLLVTLEDAATMEKIQSIKEQSKGMIARYTFNDIIGSSQAISSAIKLAKRYAQSDATVLITGESGTGKELFAQSIHNYSKRRQGPFLAVNCAALPETLIDSELFGYEKGAFTGADKAGKPGLFELAHNGTIFLDEITELPLTMQTKLLRVLQEQEVRRIGGKTVIPVDVRIICATNGDLAMQMKQGKIRTDLYHRINVLRLDLPPLRERKEDIFELASYFLQVYSHRLGVDVPALLPEIMSELEKYRWPGNVRELESFIEKYVLSAHDRQSVFNLLKELQKCDFEEEEVLSREVPGFLKIKIGTLAEMETQILEQLVHHYRIKRNEIAKILGISRTTLWRKITGRK